MVIYPKPLKIFEAIIGMVLDRLGRIYLETSQPISVVKEAKENRVVPIKMTHNMTSLV